MQFFSAISGWQWLVVAGVPAGILALYFLKLRRQPLEVPSTFLWKRSIEDLHVNSLWQRLRRSLLLFLQLLVALLLIVSLLRPMFEEERTGRHWILALDNSASMSARDLEPSRLDIAKQHALQMVEQMQPGDVAMVLSFADRAQVACSYTQNRTVLRQAIEGVLPTARTTDLSEAVTIASGLANPENPDGTEAEAIQATMYVFSDGVFPTLPDRALGRLALRYMAVGSTGGNVAIVTMGARRAADGSDRWQVLARLENFGDQEARVGAELLVDGATRDLQTVSIPPKDSTSLLFRLSAVEQAVLSIRLNHEDPLPLDNQAWTVIEPPRKVRILVVGPENPILRSALGTEAIAEIAKVQYETATDPALQGLADRALGDQYDLVIFDRCAPTVMPDANTFFLGSLPPGLASSPKSLVQNPVIVNWTTTHPILRHLALEDVALLEAFRIALPNNAQPLIETDQGTVLFSVPRSSRTDVVQTFPLLGEDGRWKTDWPLKLSFPLYIFNLVRYLAGAEASETSYLAGSAVTIPGGGAEVATVNYPSGKSQTLQVSQRGNFEFLSTDELGVYLVQLGGESKAFAVNLLSERESAIHPRAQVEIGSQQAQDASGELTSRVELWKPLALAALAIVLFEWYVYHRRGYL